MFFRSKRRKHTAGVDSIIKHLSELSHSMKSAAAAADIDEGNVKISSDFVEKLNEMLSASHTQHMQLFANISALNHILQVGCILLLSFLCLTDVQHVSQTYIAVHVLLLRLFYNA